MLLASGGVEYALTELEKSASEGPTKENRKITEFIFQNWHKTPPEFDLFDFRPGYQVPTMTPRETAIGLIKIAIKSDDAGLWVRTMDMCKFEDEIDLNRFGLEYIVAGWEKFKLEDIEAAWVLSFDLGFMVLDLSHPAFRLDRIMNGLPTVEGSLTVIKAFQNSKNVLHPETRRDEWFSAHLDRSFSKKVDGSALSLIMEVACSKGLDYMSRVYENQCILHSFLAENVFQSNTTSTRESPGGLRLLQLRCPCAWLTRQIASLPTFPWADNLEPGAL